MEVAQTGGFHARARSHRRGGKVYEVHVFTSISYSFTRLFSTTPGGPDDLMNEI